MLWGEKIQTDFDTLEQFVQQMNYTDITLGGNVTNVTATPYAVEVRADEHTDVLRLTFYDKLSRAYTAEGSYNVAGEVLTVDPCGKTYDDALFTKTSPAIIMAWALLRLGASPFSTSALSRRSFGILFFFLKSFKF